MAQFRALKTQLRAALSGDDWREQASPLLAQAGRQAVGPLFSFLLLGGEMTGRAALCLGDVVAKMADEDKESGRVIMRRFMWHMNEESGNIGWGIPEAMAACLVAHEGLAKEFHRILLSYIRDREGDSNFCDYAPLRRHCFWAVGYFIQHRPDLVVQSGLVSALYDALLAGLDDEDIPCRAYAAWALGIYLNAFAQIDMPNATAHEDIQNRVKNLSENITTLELFEDGYMRKHDVHKIIQDIIENSPMRREQS